MEYFITIDRRGILSHEQNEIDDPGFLDFLYRNIKRNETGKYDEYEYCIVTRTEKYFIKAEDTPFVFSRYDGQSLWYAPSLAVEFSVNDLMFSTENGVLYHKSPLSVYGRIAPSVLMEISHYIEPFGHEFYSIQLPSQSYKTIIEQDVRPVGKQILRPKIGNTCVGCGTENPIGFQLSFIYDETQRTASTWLTPDKRFTGSTGAMHGGFIALLLDEAMGKSLTQMKVKAPTANLNIRYKKPVIIGKKICVTGKLERNEGRKYHVSGTITDVETGELLATAEALFIALRQ